MPKDTVERAIKRAAGGEDSAVYEEVRYEGYGPGGAAIIVEALTDNRNRTASEVRAAFAKAGGNLGETNSVAFLFERKGVIVYPAKAGTPEQIFEAALDAGVDNVESGAEVHEITCAPEGFSAARDALEARLGPAGTARLQWRPLNSVAVEGPAADLLVKLVEALEDNDDVQNVSSNFDLSEETLARLTA